MALGLSAGLVLLASAAPAFAGTSKLWGADGEAWSPQGRLPDFSHAGYRAGEAPLPEVKVKASVKDFGAKGDGVTDDTAAFQAALAAVSEGALLVPAGRYVITGMLDIAKSGVVLRGEGSGPGGTVLYFPKSFADLYGPDPKWSWTEGFIRMGPTAPSAAPLTPVKAPAVRRDDALSVAEPGALSAGQLVLLQLTDDETRSLGRHLHADNSEAGTCAYQVPLTLEWPVRVAEIAGNEVRLAQPLRTDVRPAWKPAISSFSTIEEVGVEHLRIEFPNVPYAGHLKEPGYNAIFMHDGVVDGWVRDVTIVNADTGIHLSHRIKQVTVLDTALEGRTGHHGYLAVYSADILFDNFRIDAPWIHALSVSKRANGVVYSRGGGSALPLKLDHHGDSPFENLFTQIDAPFNFEHGGEACVGPGGGARNTYWNLASPMPVPLEWGAFQTNVVGTLGVADYLTPDAAWYESIEGLAPANLYEAQVARRFCEEVFDACNTGRYEVATASCTRAPRPDGTVCDDGSSVTEGDVCSAGVCAGVDHGGCAMGGGGASSAAAMLVLVGLLAGKRRRVGRFPGASP